MASSTIVSAKSDADILADLQGLGLSGTITAYSSLIGTVVTSAAALSAGDKNSILAYFQQGNHLQVV